MIPALTLAIMLQRDARADVNAGFSQLEALEQQPAQQLAAKVAADASRRALEARLRQQVRDARIALDAMDDRGTVDAQFYAIMDELQRTWRRIREIEAQR